MISILEIFCIWLVCATLIKKKHNWKSNLVSTGVIIGTCLFAMSIITNKVALGNFSKGIPLCTRGENSFCIHYAACVIYITGKLVWRYHTNDNRHSYPNSKQIAYYIIHSIPIILIYFGLINNWNLQIQFAADLFLLLIISVDSKVGQMKKTPKDNRPYSWKKKILFTKNL